jgi:hypothetical protein
MINFPIPDVQQIPSVLSVLSSVIKAQVSFKCNRQVIKIGWYYQTEQEKNVLPTLCSPDRARRSDIR